MRIYKIKNQEKFEAAAALLKLLKAQKKENLKIIKTEITPFKWRIYLGYETGFHLLPEYIGFKPKKPLNEIPEGWRKEKDNPEILVPSKRYKAGKEIAKKLNELKNYSYHKIEQTLGFKTELNGRFTVPKLRKSKNKKIIFLIVDSKVKLNKEDFKEVTITYAHKKLGIK